ncbi:MAG: ATP-binding protein [Desulfobacteraceae bacterium]|nr:ATP-binding protein [Desulfobacteraceae bacterium]
MESGNRFDHCLLLRVGVVAKGSRCLSIMRLIDSIKPTRLRLKLVALVSTTKSATCLKFAGEQGIPIYDSYEDLVSMENLDLILEMSGDAKIMADLVMRKPDSVGLLDSHASMLILDIARQYEMVAEKESEISLASSFASAMLEASPDGVMVTDRNMRIIKCNNSPLILRGQAREEVLGRNCYEMLHARQSRCDADKLTCPVQETLKTRRPARAVHEITTEDGQIRTCHVTSYPLFNQLGDIVQLVEVVRDITKDLSERIEQRTQAIKNDLTRVVQEDRLASLGRLVASVCHEINNPIASIVTFNKLILSYLQENILPPEGIEAFVQYLELSVKEAMRCGDIVKRLLSFARQKNIEATTVDLIEIVNTIMLLTAHQLNMAQVSSEIRLPSPPFTAMGDYALIQQCLMNLIFNAMEAMPKGGRIIIDGGSNIKEKKVWLSITDTGRGIDSEDLPHIFEPFFTTKKGGKGTGLGLSMVYGIVREHNGTIEVESIPGSGTTFKVVLPIGAAGGEVV